MTFRNRAEAGRQLAARLRPFAAEKPIVIALPRGGVPVGHEVAEALRAPLDILVVRKIGAPSNPEFGIGAVTEEEFYWIDPATQASLGLNDRSVQTLILERSRQVRDYVVRDRGGRPLIDIAGRVVILVDDGLATGVTALVASQYLRQNGASRVILAVPVASPDSARVLRPRFDEIVALTEPPDFMAVGSWYHDFTEVSDREVVRLLTRTAPASGSADHEDLAIPLGHADLPGTLALPARPVGLVLFAHGSGSSRLSPRNREVARILNEADIATYLFDLLTPEESEDRANVFDIVLLGRRLVTATRHLAREPRFARQPIGYFGASTGGGAALWAAAELGDRIAAVVSRGGRPDLAHPRLSQVEALSLLIVGENDPEVMRLNRQALRLLKFGELTTIPRATHLFEEPGALEQVARHSSWWFVQAFKQYTRKRAA
jgi:putative phosphoribosyl transferase